MRIGRFGLLVVALLLAFVPAARAGESTVLKAMNDELWRSFKEMKGKEYAPLYYIQYEITETEDHDVSAVLGAVQTDNEKKSRFLDVALRVGDYALDNTHEIRGQGEYRFYSSEDMMVPVVDDYNAIRSVLWEATDGAFKSAQERYIRVKQDKAVKVEEEDPSPDFSRGEAHTLISPHKRAQFDSEAWREELKQVSARFKDFPYVLSSSASISVSTETKYIVDSEKTKLEFGQDYIRVSLYGESKADDGMRLYRARRYEARGFGELPDKSSLMAAVDSIAGELDKLRNAPMVEPYIGPAILMGKASGVFFHEIFGHRIEGHRQKRSGEGQTFTKKVGQQILPEFMSVYDDPGQERFGGRCLWGHYPYDDEGVRAQRASIVENGVLKGFLMSRSPIKGFPASNGHGRKEQGRKAVSRQGNLIVESSRTVTFPRLREMLIEECKRQGKPYGLVFEDISGGFTMMGRWTPQAFKVIPLLVYRVYADGTPDEVVRGVDIVGTPLTCFARIVATGDDYDIFNGYCGAESGRVPVSAVSPSILVSEIEVEKKAKEQDRPPVLGTPVSAVPVAPEDPLMRAMEDELTRSAGNLAMEGLEKPYYVEYTVKDITSVNIEASFGALLASDLESRRELWVDLRVGDYSFDNTNYVSGGFDFANPERIVREEDYGALRHQLWLATDEAYKSALEGISQKRAYMKTRQFEETPEDMSRVRPYVHLEKRAELGIDRAEWEAVIAGMSAIFKKHPGILDSRAKFFAVVDNQYFINTEGSRHLKPAGIYGLEVTATAQADDGTEMKDFVTAYSLSEEGLPAPSEMEDRVEAMAALLEKKAKASTVEDYVGPVLLMGQASAEFVEQLFGQNVSNPRPPLCEEEEMSQMVPGGKLAGKMGRMVFPDFMDVTDDPTLERWGDRGLLGGYRVDDDGVAPERVELVNNGKLTGLLMSRMPTKKVKESNGHGRSEYGNVVGRASNLIVESEKEMAAEELVKELRTMCGDFGLEYGLVVEKMSMPGFSDQMDYYSMYGQGRQGPRMVTDPVTVYKVDVKTGEKELVRGFEFAGVTLRTMRDIVATGSEPYVYGFLSSLLPFGDGVPTSVVCPSLLIEEMELKKSSAETPRPPVLRNPFFQ